MYESGEMYLETILVLKKTQDKIRSIDLARELDFSKASVSRAVGILKDDAYISIDQAGFIDFTDKGLDRAKSIYDKHIILSRFFRDILKVSEETAEEDACKIEHVISEESFQCLKKYMNGII